MKSEGKKTPSPLRYLCGILAVWTVLIGFSKFAGGRAGSGSIRIPAAALLLIVIPAAVFAISRFGTLCAYMRSHSGALRRGTALLCALALSLSAFTLPAEAAVSGSLSDANIGWSESEISAGTPGKGTATGNTASSSWAASGTQITGTVTPAESSATSGGGCGGSTTTYYYSSEATSTLTITNQSTEKRLLTFSYTVPSAGTLTIDETVQTKDSSFSKALDPNGTVLIKLTTSATPDSSTSSNPSAYAASATLSNLSLTSLNRDISVTFAQPAHGSYTVKAGSTALKVGETYTKPVTTQYTLSARADANYVFDGWYVNDTKVSVAATYTTVFSDDCTVEARFAGDPLFSVIQMSDPAADKSAYVEASSSYYHEIGDSKSKKGSSHTNVGDTSANNSYGEPTYFPYSTWSASNGAIQSSESGTATGDNQTTWGYSQASATLYSDIIRVKCKENCIITFDSSMNAQSVSISNSNSSDNQYGVFLYYYTTASASANANTIKTNGTAAIEGSKKTSGSANTRVVVNKDEYLYLYAYAKTRKDKMTNSGYETDNYSYTATISNFTVTPNTTEHTFTTGNRDNTGTVLKSGSVKINGTAQGVSSGTYSYKAADNATLTLTPGTAPTGYTFIGWHNVTDNVYDYTNSTYTVKMTKDYEVNPIYVPAMTITAGGANGYGSADYQYKSLSGQMVTPNGQYVARNADCSKFYTDLNAAFSDTNTVFLLAGDTFNGSLTIPTGKTLVIPDRLADSGPAASQPEQVTSSAGISSYCKVTLNGNLTVDGKLVVNGMQSSTANGRAAGGIGYLSLSDSAAVTVSSGGELCGYGQIRGGSISAKNGSTVRELMEISDRRAALVMKEIDDKKSSMRVFPFSNFSIKTIESPVTYASGAKLYAQYSIMLEGNNQSTGAVLIFGPSGALFNLTQGSMTKSFDLAKDKTVYRLNEGGKMSTGSFQLDVKFGVSGYGSTTITIKSQEYWMPLNAGFDLRTAGDMTVNSDFKFLPGASLSVEKGGTCTVASSAKLLFYRLNDYDTRGIGNGTYQKGYSAKVYPVNATNLPGGGYTHPKLDTVGSARLNVDGEMIVNGGLYVSDELVSQSNQGFTGTEPVDGVEMSRKDINAAYFKVYPNGYNVLTGTGSINMTAAQTSETQVYEAMTSQNTNDPAWAPIKITPIAGLKADATVDNSDNYQPLTQATYYGVYQPGGFYTWTTEKPVVAKIVNGANEQTYRSLAAAVQDYTAGTGYIQMLKDSTEPGFTVDRNVTLDLNGKTVKLAGTMTVAAGCTLSGMDSSSKEYAAPTGKIVGKVTGYAPTYQTPTVKVENVDTYDRYVAISGLEADGKTANLSFHHFNISVTGYRFELAAPQCALFFIGTFRGDDAAKAYLSKLGFTLKGNNDMSLGEADYVFTADTVIPPESEAGDSPVVLSGDAYLFEVYLNRSFKKDEPNGYTEKIGATAQATFKNGGTQNSETKQWSFEDAWTESEGLKDLTPEQKAILDKFLKELGITKQAE